MALTKATLIDLNANELILDLDADTSITADSDDTIDFKIGGSDEIKMTTTALTPAVADGSALGTAALEWSDLFLADAAVISLGADQDVTLTHVHNEGLLLNSTMKLEFNDASQFVQGSSATVLSIGATDEIDLTATLIDINGNLDVSGTITIGNAAITEAELEQIDGITAGTALASKALIADANIDITGLRNVTATGTITSAGFTIGSAAITEAELEILDGLASTTAELGVIDGDTSATGTTLVAADRVVVNDNGTMVQVAMSDFETFMESNLDTLSSVTTVGALNAGSITSGFGTIDTGSSTITSTGDITGGTFAATGDTAAGDNASIGYTAGEGLILTGQGSTSDVVIKNDADATVFSIATGTTTGTFAGTVLAKTDTDTSNTGSITLDFTANQNFVLTLTGNVTLANPSTEQVGQSGFIAFIQDGTGSRTVSLGTDYETAAAAGLTLTSTASATDLVPYLVVSSNRILLGTPQLAFA